MPLSLKKGGRGAPDVHRFQGNSISRLRFDLSLLPILSGLLAKLIWVKPEIRSDDCIGCGDCAAMCPADAILLASQKAVIDHTGKNTFEERIRSGAITGLRVCYDKLTAEEAAELVIQNPDKREIMTIGSELGYGGAGHLSLVKVAWALRMEGIAREDIESVMWENPKKLFNLPIN